MMSTLLFNFAVDCSLWIPLAIRGNKFAGDDIKL